MSSVGTPPRALLGGGHETRVLRTLPDSVPRALLGGGQRSFRNFLAK